MNLQEVYVKGVRLCVNPETQEEFTAVDVAALVPVKSKTTGRTYLGERKASFTTPLTKEMAEKLFSPGEVIGGSIERVALDKPLQVILKNGQEVTITHENFYRFEE